PLSALVGRTDVFRRAMANAHYTPTFRGEVYSLAAAKAAIHIYRQEPVAQYVWDYGTNLQQGINRLSQDLGVGAACLGPPFRMTTTFLDIDAERLRLKRTLYHQELLAAGVVTCGGTMLPSYAHDEKALQTTLEAVGHALESVRAAERENS